MVHFRNDFAKVEGKEQSFLLSEAERLKLGIKFGLILLWKSTFKI